MDLEDLHEAYNVSKKHNSRSEDMVAFEVDLYVNLRVLLKKIIYRSYVPLHNYSFINHRSEKPREVFAAEPELKIMMAYALMRISPIIERHLHPRTFNNRVGMGSHLAVNTLIDDIYEVSEGYTKPCWIIKTDYNGYFPNMVQDIVWDKVYNIVDNEYNGKDKEDVIYCLEVACFCDPKLSKRRSPLWEWNDYPSYKSVYNKLPGIGGFIGYTFWQMVASLLPTEIDYFVEQNMSKHFVRYVDDTVIITDNKEMVLSMFPEYRKRLALLGLTMHSKKFYCQPFEHGLEFLGYYIRTGRVHLKRTTVKRGMHAVKDTRKGLDAYISSINSYLGILKGTNDLRIAKKILDSINKIGIIKDYENYKILRDPMLSPAFRGFEVLV